MDSYSDRQTKASDSVRSANMKKCISVLAPAAVASVAAILLSPGNFVSIPPIPEDAQHTTLMSRIFIGKDKKVDWRQFLVHGLVVFALTSGVMYAMLKNQRAACVSLWPKKNNKNAAGAMSPASNGMRSYGRRGASYSPRSLRSMESPEAFVVLQDNE